MMADKIKQDMKKMQRPLLIILKVFFRMDQTYFYCDVVYHLCHSKHENVVE